MPEQPTVLICIGAPKAGTTWLYEYLAGHPDCHFRAVKELHFFDSRDGRDGGYNRRVLEGRALRLRERLAATPFWGPRRRLRKTLADVESWLAIERGADDAAYVGYMCDGLGRARLVGDITPCYAALGREDFARMARVAEDVRFVYVLRDPVDRAWSQARMRGIRAADAARPAAQAAFDVFDRFLAGGEDGFRARSDYARTLTELLAAVPRDRVHVEFYEQFFRQEALDRLTAFLDIRPWPGKLERVKHKGNELPLDPDRRSRAMRALSRQYAFCEEFFNGRLPERWRAHMLEA